jgi:hypothetical protein
MFFFFLTRYGRHAVLLGSQKTDGANCQLPSEVLNSRSGDYEDGCLLQCDTEYYARIFPTFQINLLPPPYTLNTEAEAAGTSEILVRLYWIVWRCISKTVLWRIRDKNIIIWTEIIKMDDRLNYGAK